MRNLASVQKVSYVKPIENADRIEEVGILGWTLVSKKGELKVGDLCVYIEIDSLLPKEIPAFAFMADRKYRVKSIKMRGVCSQGLAMPFSAFLPYFDFSSMKEGDDLTEILKIGRYEKEDTEDVEVSGIQQKWWYKYRKNWFFKTFLLPFIAPKKKDGFPTHLISKSDQTNIQNLPRILSEFKGETFAKSEKLEGQSATFSYEKVGRRGVFYVCGRNLRLANPNNSNYWYIAQKYNMESILKKLMEIPNSKAWAIQGEICGGNIQGNIYKLPDRQFFVYKVVQHLKDGTSRTLGIKEGMALMAEHGLSWVPYCGEVTFGPEATIQNLLDDADGKSTLADVLREGYVYVCLNPNKPRTFKVKSNKYILLHDKNKEKEEKVLESDDKKIQ